MIEIRTPAQRNAFESGQEFRTAIEKCKTMSEYGALCAEFESKSSSKIASWHRLGLDQMRRQIREAKHK